VTWFGVDVEKVWAGGGIAATFNTPIGGIMFAYSEGGSKRTFAGIIFGLGMALGAVNFMSWLFGVA
jgi:H+/Cl- antiporter ClcA